MNAIDFSHSLLYNDTTASNFFKTFRLNPNDYRTDEDDHMDLEKAVEYLLTQYSDNLDALSGEFKQKPFIDGRDQYVVGEMIGVCYSPSSQRYVEYYDEQTFKGYIFFVDSENGNMFLFNRTGDKIFTHSLEREGCHYFGMCRGYTFHICRE